MAERVTSMATLPPPMTQTRLPFKSIVPPSASVPSISTAEMTPFASSPGRPTFLSVCAPMEM